MKALLIDILLEVDDLRMVTEPGLLAQSPDCQLSRFACRVDTDELHILFLLRKDHVQMLDDVDLRHELNAR